MHDDPKILLPDCSIHIRGRIRLFCPFFSFSSMGDVLRFSLIQTNIVWEDKRANLDKYAVILSHITGDCDLVVFSEMFTTGFSMRAEDLAECIDGETITF